MAKETNKSEEVVEIKNEDEDIIKDEIVDETIGTKIPKKKVKYSAIKNVPLQDEVMYKTSYKHWWVFILLAIVSIVLSLFLTFLFSIMYIIPLILFILSFRGGVTRAYIAKERWKLAFFFLLSMFVAVLYGIVVALLSVQGGV